MWCRACNILTEFRKLRPIPVKDLKFVLQVRLSRMWAAPPPPPTLSPSTMTSPKDRKCEVLIEGIQARPDFSAQNQITKPFDAALLLLHVLF